MADFTSEIFPNPDGLPELLIKFANTVAAYHGDSDNHLVEAASELLKSGSASGAGGGSVSAGGARHIVMGHTHFPVISDHFFNTGTWIPTYLQQDTPQGDFWREPLPFLLLYRGETGETGKVESHYFAQSGDEYYEVDSSYSDRRRRAVFGADAKTLDNNDKIVPIGP